jgi:hypothetical protein
LISRCYDALMSVDYFEERREMVAAVPTACPDPLSADFVAEVRCGLFGR